MVPGDRIELSTPRSSGVRSTTELPRQKGRGNSTEPLDEEQGETSTFSKTRLERV